MRQRPFCFLYFVPVSYESEGTLMRARTDAARPPAASLSDFDVTDCSSDSLFSVRLLLGRSIKRDLAIYDSLWEINSSVLAWTVQGGTKQDECGKEKELSEREGGWDDERWSKQNQRSRHESTRKHWIPSVESDTEIHVTLLLMEQSNCTVEGSLRGLVKG